MGKQVREKCLTYKPESETQNLDFVTADSRSVILLTATSLRR